MSYKISEHAVAARDFRDGFSISIEPFYDSFVSIAVFQMIKIDPFKFDDFLHCKHGNYEETGQSMEDIVLEKYGTEALKTLRKLL